MGVSLGWVVAFSLPPCHPQASSAAIRGLIRGGEMGLFTWSPNREVPGGESVEPSFLLDTGEIHLSTAHNFLFEPVA